MQRKMKKNKQESLAKEMAQWVKVSAAKLDDPDLILRTYTADRELLTTLRLSSHPVPVVYISNLKINAHSER